MKGFDEIWDFFDFMKISEERYAKVKDLHELLTKYRGIDRLLDSGFIAGVGDVCKSYDKCVIVVGANSYQRSTLIDLLKPNRKSDYIAKDTYFIHDNGKDVRVFANPNFKKESWHLTKGTYAAHLSKKRGSELGTVFHLNETADFDGIEGLVEPNLNAIVHYLCKTPSNRVFTEMPEFLQHVKVIEYRKAEGFKNPNHISQVADTIGTALDNNQNLYK